MRCEDHRPLEMPRDERTLSPEVHRHGELKEMAAMCGWGWSWGSSGWGGTVMTIVLAVFLVAVIVAVVFGIRDLFRGGGQRNGGSSEATGPEDTLAHRFARGEMDADEYRQRAALLREHL